MKRASSNCLVICISPGVHGRWDVSGKGSSHPLASFAQREDACAYANTLAMRAGEAAILVEDRDGFSPLAVRPPTQPAPHGKSRTSQT